MMPDNFILWLAGELAQVGSSLLDTSKRVSLWYLLSAVLFAWLMLSLRYGLMGWRRLKPFLSWRVWWHRSARTDYQLWLANRLLLAIVIPKTLTQAVWISWLYFYWLEQGFSDLRLGWSDAIVMGLFSLCYFLVDDFSRFLVHWAMHKFPVLWAFHQVHHSAKVLTPFTVFRTHPIEGLLFFLRSMAAQSLVISVFLVAFPNQVSLWQVFGVLITTFVFNALGANLRHSGVALSYGPRIEKWLISPAQHQVHHSVARAHYDRNFGVTLAIWDRLFGSWHQGHDDQVIRYGTGQAIDEMGWLGQWLQPIKDGCLIARRGVKKSLSLGKKNAQPSQTEKGAARWKVVSKGDNRLDRNSELP